MIGAGRPSSGGRTRHATARASACLCVEDVFRRGTPREQNGGFIEMSLSYRPGARAVVVPAEACRSSSSDRNARCAAAGTHRAEPRSSARHAATTPLARCSPAPSPPSGLRCTSPSDCRRRWPTRMPRRTWPGSLPRTGWSDCGRPSSASRRRDGLMALRDREHRSRVEAQIGPHDRGPARSAPHPE